jgi:endonuclease/exonuclease/phosphatase family metal-dependent hydrolase
LGDHQGHARKQQRWPVGGQDDLLADQIWSQYAYGRNTASPLGHRGNAVLSKLPIAAHKNHDVSIAGPERRGLLHCQLQRPDGGHLDVICVHLSLLESRRRKQLGLLCDLIHAGIPRHAPLVVAGDFNDWRGNAHHLLLRGAGLLAAHVAHSSYAPRTYPARWPILRLDRIYTRGFLGVTPTEMPSNP